MRLADLAPHPGNPRKITDERLVMLKKSLHEFGDLSGIIWNEQTGRTSGGHQRIKVLPPDAEIVIEQKYDTPTRTGTVAEGHVIIDGERFKYRQVRWGEEREKAANIAANKHGGEFDIPGLIEWLVHLDGLNLDTSVIGFTRAELEQLCAPIDFTNPDDKAGPTLKEPQLKKCPNCGVLIEAEIGG